MSWTWRDAVYILALAILGALVGAGIAYLDIVLLSSWQWP